MDQLNELECDLLAELLNVGFGTAAASLSEMTKEEVRLSCPTVDCVTRRELREGMEARVGAPISVVRQRFVGAVKGETDLVISTEQKTLLARAVHSGIENLDLSDELTDDVLAEVGNVILHSCTAVLTQTLSEDIIPDLARVECTDSGGPLLLDAEGRDDVPVLVTKLEFQLNAGKLTGCIALMFDLETCGLLVKYPRNGTICHRL